MIVFKSKRKIFSRVSINTRTRIFVKIFRFSRRALETNDFFETSFSSTSLFIEINDIVLIFDNQFFFQNILRNDQLFFFSNQDFDNQFFFFNVALLNNQSLLNMTQIQTFLNHERALINQITHIFDVVSM